MTRSSTRGSVSSSAPSRPATANAGQGWHPDEWRARSVDETAPRYFRLYSYGPSLEHPVAVGALEVTRDDNLAFIEGNLFVDPTERRRGYGSALLAELERCARELGRPTLLIFVIEGSREIGTGPNRSFAARHGYRVGEENVRRDLAWPRPDGELDRLWDRVESASRADYEIISWTNAHARGPCRRPRAPVGDHAGRGAARRPRRRGRTLGRRARSPARSDDRRRWDATSSSPRRATAPPVSSSATANSRCRAISPRRPTSGTRWSCGRHRGHRLGGLLKVTTMRLLEAGGYATHEDHDVQLQVERHR